MYLLWMTIKDKEVYEIAKNIFNTHQFQLLHDNER